MTTRDLLDDLSPRTILLGLGLLALLVTGLVMGPAKAQAEESQAEESRAKEPGAKQANKEAVAKEPGKSAPEGLNLNKLVFARRVEGRKPIDVGQQFSADGGRIYAHAELANIGGTKKTLVMEWAHEGKLRFTYALDVGKSRSWRTWSRIRAAKRAAGSWVVTLRDEDGRRLGSAKLSVD